MDMRIPSGELQEAVFDITLIHLFKFKTFYEELNQNQTHLVKKFEKSGQSGGTTNIKEYWNSQSWRFFNKIVFLQDWFDIELVMIPQLADDGCKNLTNIGDDREGEGDANNGK